MYNAGESSLPFFVTPDYMHLEGHGEYTEKKESHRDSLSILI